VIKGLIFIGAVAICPPPEGNSQSVGPTVTGLAYAPNISWLFPELHSP
jgi:hypothetical protein